MTQPTEKTFDPNRFVIDSHRGAFKGGLLENTIPAFAQSVEEGANMLECDLRMTGDGEIVLIHNKTIDHVMSFASDIPGEGVFGELPSGKIKDHTLAFLKAVKYPHNAEILSLNEFLEFLKRRHVGAQLELKEMGYERQILQVIQDAQIDYASLLGPVVCTSFNFFAIRRMQKLAKKMEIPLYTHSGGQGLAFGFQAIPLGSIIGKPFLRWCKKHDFWGFTTHYKHLPISRIKYAHKCGVKYCPRIPDEIDIINLYLDAGTDGIETDNVPLIRKCLKERNYELW